MIKEIYRFVNRFTNEFINPLHIIYGVLSYARYMNDLYKYRKMEGAEPISISNIHPCLFERTATTSFDAHYFYQDVWAFNKIYESKVKSHVDVGSRTIYVGILSTITKVTFIDIRPLEAKLENLECKKGDILNMPYEDNSVQSLSCLNIAEHIGLGRYGEPLDPLGTIKATKELSRILAVNGNLYFSVPIGKPKVYFNAHRNHSPQQIIDYFRGLELKELSAVTDDKVFKKNIPINILEKSNYACGLFHFRKTK